MSRSLSAAEPATLGEQRRHDRYQVEIPGILRIQEMSGGIYMVTVLDISKSGLRLSCPVPVPSGTRVEVKCQSVKVLGRVKYAREDGHGFNLGIEADLVETQKGTVAAEELDLMSVFPNNLTRLRRL